MSYLAGLEAGGAARRIGGGRPRSLTGLAGATQKSLLLEPVRRALKTHTGAVVAGRAPRCGRPSGAGMLGCGTAALVR
ncbi:hypothetical protein GCM10010178_09790 [Lentzea flava]|uniref:Uncharacterized protein n=1 Tax=Lentzea flava TaxID=103732 RepID=A0ABQ2UBZ6_9PSEU|nr:hypothetical protein GCM10010178_09790 [Lentzea flava]